MALDQSIGAKITEALNAEIARIVEAEAKEAAIRVEKQVKDLTTAIACRCLEHFNMEYSGNRLTITVDFKNKEQASL